MVRKLLNRSKLKKPANVKIIPICDKPRFEFDDIISPWLNKMNKLFLLDDFKIIEEGVSFQMETDNLTDLDLFPKEKFKIVVEK